MNIIESNIANLPTKHGNFRIKAYKDGKSRAFSNNEFRF